ncbi:rhomboid family intramembrane serine protease [Opitutaceae bacterium EW11]|nr:rhomboid family intramembrane serine protease [Opitutaceae bacterium EW11]
MLPLWDDVPHRRPVITSLLIAANLGVFGYEVMLAMESHRSLATFIQLHALVPARFFGQLDSGGQWLTVFTSMFLHGGVAHVLGNCWFLWVFGNNIEDRLGSFRYLFFYLLSGVAAAALQAAVYPQSTLPMLGASGAISGVLGAYLLLFPFALVYTLVPWIVPIIPVPAFLFLLVWFALQAFNGVGSLMSGEMGRGGVAWWAHAGGFLAGVAMILFAKSRGWVKRGRR